MERNITVTIDDARELYNSGNKNFKKIALQAFSENELKFDFRSITTFKKACEVLNIDYDNIDSVIGEAIVFGCGKSSAAKLKLNIIKRALNLGYDLELTENCKDSYIYYPYNPFADESSNYVNEFNADKSDKNKQIKIIGKIKNKGVLYNVLGGTTILSCGHGVGCFYYTNKVGYCYSDSGFLGCATEEIARHFGKYFGMLITEAKYADLKDFEIVDSYYKN